LNFLITRRICDPAHNGTPSPQKRDTTKGALMKILAIFTLFLVSTSFFNQVQALVGDYSRGGGAWSESRGSIYFDNRTDSEELKRRVDREAEAARQAVEADERIKKIHEAYRREQQAQIERQKIQTQIESEFRVKNGKIQAAGMSYKVESSKIIRFYNGFVTCENKEAIRKMKRDIFNTLKSYRTENSFLDNSPDTQDYYLVDYKTDTYQMTLEIPQEWIENKCIVYIKK